MKFDAKGIKALDFQGFFKSFPRTRGGDPKMMIFRSKGAIFSPHTRG